MIVIVREENRTTLYQFKHKLLKYFFCIIINKLKGKKVETLKEDI